MIELRLPSELWIKVFDLATKVPSELNTDGFSLFERCRHSDAITYRQQVLRTRRSLPLVSRNFYYLSTEFLYQSITVTRRTTLYSLIRTLELDPSHPVTESYGDHIQTSYPSRFAPLVKRLDVVICIRKFLDTRHEEILRLIRLLARLEILSFTGPWKLTNEDELFNTIELLHSLKLLRLPPALPRSYVSHLSSRLLSPDSVFFNLRIIESNLMTKIKVPTEFKALKKDLGTSVVSHTPGYNIRWIETFHRWATDSTFNHPKALFPRLEALTLYDNVGLRFLEAHGHNITTVYVLDVQVFLVYRQHFPNLRDVILEFYSTLSLNYRGHGKVAAQQVKRVGISTARDLPTHHFFNRALEELPLYFPNMECLRILDKRCSDSLLQHRKTRLVKWQKDSHIGRFRLEREDGELLIA